MPPDREIQLHIGPRVATYGVRTSFRTGTGPSRLTRTFRSWHGRSRSTDHGRGAGAEQAQPSLETAFNDLELYLMGLLPSDSVDPHVYLATGGRATLSTRLRP